MASVTDDGGKPGSLGQLWAAYGARPRAARWTARTALVLGVVFGVLVLLAAAAIVMLWLWGVLRWMWGAAGAF